MADAIFVVATLVFFAICVAYVRALDRMVRKTEEDEAKQESSR